MKTNRPQNPILLTSTMKLPPVLTLLLIASATSQLAKLNKSWFLRNRKLSNQPTSTSQRPFYIIGHMVNSILLVKQFLDFGANVLESDIEFNRDGTVKEIHHGFPCDFLRVCEDREDLGEYLQYVRSITSPDLVDGYYGRMVMQFFDLKLKTSFDKMRSGEDMARHVLEYLWGDGREREIKVLIYIEDPSNIGFIEEFIREFARLGQTHRLKDVGFDGGMGRLTHIKEMFHELNSTNNIWQGDGITNFLSTFWSNRRLKEALDVRDSDNGYIKKVYDWTKDKKRDLRKSLRLNVDGIITNKPERLIKVLGEREFEGRYRLATIDDDPFERYEG